MCSKLWGWEVKAGWAWSYGKANIFYHGQCLKGKPWSLGHPVSTLTKSYQTDQLEAWRNNKNRFVCNGLVLCPGPMVDLDD